MMRDPLSKDFDPVDNDGTKVEEPVDSRVTASNAIKYTCYIMLLFGLLYFLMVYIAPLL